MKQEEYNIDVIWKVIEQLHQEGYSIVPCRAEDEYINGKLKKAKSPLSNNWSHDPDKRFTLGELSRIINRHPNAKILIGVVCGKASDNLEAIDIDPKHWEGIGVQALVTLQQTNPELYDKLVIDNTPSGGIHLCYRCEEPVSGNTKLAYKEGEKEAGIETRGQGGYIIFPPGLGYKKKQDVQMPRITKAERDWLINFFKMFDQKQKRTVTPISRKLETIYDEKPSQHFNNSPEASEVLVQAGWTVYKDTTLYTYYTRPGKDGGVSASYNKEKGFYYIFTSSTDLEGSKGYDPAALMCKLMFDGDFKKLYSYLVDKGYGKLKASYEAQAVRKFAESGRSLPANFSSSAISQLEAVKQEMAEKYPHGKFWEYELESNDYFIHRELMDQFMFSIGLRLHKGQPCIIKGQFVYKLNEDRRKPGARDVYRILNDWIREDDEDAFKKIRHEFNKFWQYHGEHMVFGLPELETDRILLSNSKACYKFFKHSILRITANEKKELPYSDMKDYLIWAHEVIDREWSYVGVEDQKKCIYGDYLGRAILASAEYLKLIIGYLCCGYKGPNENYLIALLEPTEASLGGGTGKGFFVKILRFWTGVLVRNGIAVKKDIEQLLQNWNGEQIVHLSDLPKGIDLSYLKHLITDDSQLKKLYRDIMNVAAEDMPKFVVSGQFGLNVEDDGGNKRRIRMVPFSGAFHGHDSLRKAYGGELPDIWTIADWNGYFSIIADAVQAYLAVRSLEIVENDELWLKSYDARYAHDDSYLREAIDEAADGWCTKDYWLSDEISDWYTAVCDRNRVLPSERMVGMRKVHKAIKEYLERHQHYTYEYGRDRISSNGSRPWIVRIRKLPDEE